MLLMLLLHSLLLIDVKHHDQNLLHYLMLQPFLDLMSMHHNFATLHYKVGPNQTLTLIVHYKHCLHYFHQGLFVVKVQSMVTHGLLHIYYDEQVEKMMVMRLLLILVLYNRDQVLVDY